MDAPAEIKGVPLNTFVDDLRKVPVHLNRKPVATFDGMERIGPHARAYAASRFGENRQFNEVSRDLPLKALARLTLDEICKIRYSSDIMMDSSVEDVFQKEPRYRIISKITNSMWRCGFSRGQWNEVVDAYDGIRGFNLDLPDFEVRLDHTTGWNECGYTEYSRVFIDGVFAFLIYYRGVHVMTLGFSIQSGKNLLIRQVQLRERRGNRWLFKLPKDRMEFFLDRFRESFPRHRLHIVDGGDVARKSLNSYRNGRSEALERIARIEARAKRDKWDESSLIDAREEVKVYNEKIKHIKADIERLAAFYRSSGPYAQGRSRKVSGLTHYALKLAA